MPLAHPRAVAHLEHARTGLASWVAPHERMTGWLGIWSVRLRGKLAQSHIEPSVVSEALCEVGVHGSRVAGAAAASAGSVALAEWPNG
jgi:hypothetical protein